MYKTKQESQMDWVRTQLETHGYVTRNEALRNYISRLGAYICDLRKADWKISSGYVKTEFGKDYKYTLIK